MFVIFLDILRRSVIDSKKLVDEKFWNFVDLHQTYFINVCYFVFLSTGDLNIGILDENDRKYPMEGLEEFNIEKIKEFIDDYDVGKRLIHERWQKESQPWNSPLEVMLVSCLVNFVLTYLCLKRWYQAETEVTAHT